MANMWLRGDEESDNKLKLDCWARSDLYGCEKDSVGGLLVCRSLFFQFST